MFSYFKNCSSLFPQIYGKIMSPVCFSSVVPSSSQIPTSPELDVLYKTIVVEVKGHDRHVLHSYEYFTKTAAAELGINIEKIWEDREDRARRTLLKSIFVHKKHRVQYEFRTYNRIFWLKHLTGSTADTFLEYIQRNLPEGVAMKVTKHRIEKLPDHIANYVPDKNTKSSSAAH